MRKANADIYMRLLVFEIKQKYEDIKFTMKESWIKLIDLEKSVGELQCNKIPLICYGEDDSNSKINFANLDSYSVKESKKEPCLSVRDLMAHFGYNIHRPSWQKTLAEQPLIHLEKPSLTDVLEALQPDTFQEIPIKGAKPAKLRFIRGIKKSKRI